MSVDPQFVNYTTDMHIANASACKGDGTPTGAPPKDMDGQARAPLKPAIGADEP